MKSSCESTFDLAEQETSLCVVFHCRLDVGPIFVLAKSYFDYIVIRGMRTEA